MKKIDLLCVIEDDEIYTFLIKKLIHHAQIAEKTIFFKNGLEALDFFTEFQHDKDALPELVLLDINMPILDGWQFLDGFVKLTPTLSRDVTVYMTSSSVDEDDYNRALSFEPVKDFIRKPIDTEVLKQLVKKLESQN